jgi:hypothetical protein
MTEAAGPKRFRDFHYKIKKKLITETKFEFFKILIYQMFETNKGKPIRENDHKPLTRLTLTQQSKSSERQCTELRLIL